MMMVMVMIAIGAMHMAVLFVSMHLWTMIAIGAVYVLIHEREFPNFCQDDNTGVIFGAS